MRYTTAHVILTAESSTSPVIDNIRKSTELEAHLMTRGYVFKRAIGRYRGVQETCYIVMAPTRGHIKELKDLATSYNQPHVIEINQGHSWLLDTEERGEEYLGAIFQATGKEECYTQVGSKLFTFRREA